MDTNQTEQYNKQILSWAGKTRRIIQGKIPMRRMYGIDRGKYEEPLSASFRLNTGRKYGEIDRIGFRFSLHGVFLQKGVGRGYISRNGIVSRGSRVKIGRNIHDRRTDFRSKPGIIARKPIDWFNSKLESRFPLLSDLVAENYADRITTLFEQAKIK